MTSRRAAARMYAHAVELAVFGGGCFWELERGFAELEGVVDTRVGYAGGYVDAPTYAEVCAGGTGHLEVVEVEFDPARISYAALLERFWQLHDPTSWDRQGADEGEQYRSVIFVNSDAQAETAARSMEAVAARLDDDLVTELRPLERFWVAEDDHQRFLPRG